MRKRPKVSHGQPSHERWVISYADFVTLLFAFFVVLFATANADKGKARAVSEAVKGAFGQSKSADVQAAIQKALAEDNLNAQTKTEASLAELRASQTLLSNQLSDEIQRGEVELHMETRGLTISFKQAALFDSGEALVKDSAVPALAKVANAILKIPNQIRLEGHTDNVPIHNEHFGNNWELSSARSIAILQLLTSKFQVPVTRLAVSGYADVAPVASNATEAGRSKNRRVDIVILSSLAASTEPDKDRF